MPNWVYNTLTIESEDTDLLAAVKAKLAQPYETHFPKTEYDHDKGEWVTIPATQTNNDPLSFWNIVAPTDLDSYYARKTPKPSDEVFDAAKVMEQIKEDFRTGMSWYDWNVRNWGTKWDACEVDLQMDNPNAISYRFDTAWAPPLPALAALCEQHPELLVTLHFEEEQGWGGEIIARGNEVISQREWDIPTSHADYVARGQECINCNTPYKDSTGEWQYLDALYPDCPRDFLKESSYAQMLGM